MKIITCILLSETVCSAASDMGIMAPLLLPQGSQELLKPPPCPYILIQVHVSQYRSLTRKCKEEKQEVRSESEPSNCPGRKGGGSCHDGSRHDGSPPLLMSRTVYLPSPPLLQPAPHTSHHSCSYAMTLNLDLLSLFCPGHKGRLFSPLSGLHGSHWTDSYKVGCQLE